MTETALQQVQEETLRNGYEVVDESLSGAEWVVSADSRLPEYDETHTRLQNAGVNGDPIASFMMGEQQFAIVDVSRAETSFRTGGYKPLMGEHGRTLDTEYQLDRDMPMVLVHFTRGEGGRTAAEVRPIRRGEHILLSRDKRYAAQDPETFSTFDYGDDPSISRKHGVVSLDAERRSVVVSDVGSTFGTQIRYSKLPEAGAEARESYMDDATRDAAVGGLKNVIQRHVLHASQVRSLTGFLNQDILTLSRKDTAEISHEDSGFLGAVSTMGTRVVVELLNNHYQLPRSRQARENLRTVVNRAAALVDVLDGRESRQASAFEPVLEDINDNAHVNGYELCVALGALAEASVSLQRRPSLRAAVEDYASSMLDLIGDIAEANRGIRVTQHMHQNLNHILQKRDQLKIAR